MSIRLDPYFSEPDITDLIERCAVHQGESDFTKFRSAWHPYLEAALALVSPNWSTAQRLYEQIYEEYFNDFKRPKRAFQTGSVIYLLAVGYSYLIQQSGDESLQQLSTHMFGGDRPEAMSQHEFYIVVFCAILRMPGLCVTPLLTACFPPSELRCAYSAKADKGHPCPAK
jgi:hypothetical protein